MQPPPLKKVFAMNSVVFVAALTGIGVFSSSTVHSTQPEYIQLIRRGQQMPQEWYAEQARLWKQEVARKAEDAASWRNYYMATQYSMWGPDSPEREQILDRIFTEMGKAVSDGHEYLYLDVRRSSWDRDRQELNDLFARATRLCSAQPECADLYQDLAGNFEQLGDRERARSAWEEMYLAEGIPSGLIDYNYNMLMSTDQNAILVTNGDNDTYPAWMLQRLKGIREDVLVLNIYLSRKYRSHLSRELSTMGIEIDAKSLPASDADFLEALCEAVTRSQPDVLIYVALTVASRYKEKLNDRLYVTGLASLYSEDRADNVALLKRNVERRFRLDHLQHDWYSEHHISTVPHVIRVNGNYAIPFIMLFEHYRTAEEMKRASYWSDLALEVARKSRNEDFLKEIELRIDQ